MADPNDAFLSQINIGIDPNDKNPSNQEKLVIFINGINSKKKRVIGDKFQHQIEINDVTNEDFFFLDLDDVNSTSHY
jgi:hypothetical protein